MGKLIVIEGLDASGKQTQTELLCKALKEKGYSMMQVAFPCYESPSSALVKMYLKGDFGGDAKDVNPYAASSFYAVDRFASYKANWGKFYEAGGIVIADRYTTSNMIHQGGKIENKSEKDAYLEWLYEYEFKKLGLPEPDAVIFLDMPPLFSEKLMEKRANKITGQEEKDIHEKDKGHIESSYKSAMYVSEKFNWEKVSCVRDNKVRTIEEIHEEILKKALSLIESK